MSDTWQGPGWWEASDGKWYPPEPGTPRPGKPPLGEEHHSKFQWKGDKGLGRRAWWAAMGRRRQVGLFVALAVVVAATLVGRHVVNRPTPATKVPANLSEPELNFVARVHQDIGRQNSDAAVVEFGRFVCSTYAKYGPTADKRDNTIIAESGRLHLQAFGLITGAALIELCPQYRGYG
ncbi:MAG: hypothetical protein ACR2HY_09485 [Acidimicrobiales bacterium]